MTEVADALVIGAGPAGLMAAEALMAPGRTVVVAEAMPTPARKFLMAGKSGLNLTKDEPFEAFAQRFRVGTGALPRTLVPPAVLGPRRVVDGTPPSAGDVLPECVETDRLHCHASRFT